MRALAWCTAGAVLGVLVASIAGAAPRPPHARAAPAVRTTRVVTFRPTVPSGRRRGGECWTESAAVDRPQAWRCSAANEIYDPCFTVASLRRAVVCGADPARKRPGFVLTLTKPLPRRSAPRRSASSSTSLPWLVALADGSVCALTTGTSAQVDGEDVPYECSDSRACTDDGCPYLTGITTKLRRGSVWSAQKLVFRSSDADVALLARRRVRVVTAWQ